LRSCAKRALGGGAESSYAIGPRRRLRQRPERKAGFTLDQINEGMGDIPISSVFHGVEAYPELACIPLLEAMTFDGGEDVLGAARILLRTAAPALLYASHPDVCYPRSDEEVVAAVDLALASGDRATMLELAEQLACDL